MAKWEIHDTLSPERGAMIGFDGRTNWPTKKAAKAALDELMCWGANATSKEPVARISSDGETTLRYGRLFSSGDTVGRFKLLNVGAT